MRRSSLAIVLVALALGSAHSGLAGDRPEGRIEGPFGTGASAVWLLLPRTAPRSIVVFGHGWKVFAALPLAAVGRTVQAVARPPARARQRGDLPSLPTRRRRGRPCSGRLLPPGAYGGIRPARPERSPRHRCRLLIRCQPRLLLRRKRAPLGAPDPPGCLQRLPGRTDLRGSPPRRCRDRRPCSSRSAIATRSRGKRARNRSGPGSPLIRTRASTSRSSGLAPR